MFITDQTDTDLTVLEAGQRGRIWVENHIRCGAASGLEKSAQPCVRLHSIASSS